MLRPKPWNQVLALPQLFFYWWFSGNETESACLFGIVWSHVSHGGGSLGREAQHDKALTDGVSSLSEQMLHQEAKGHIQRALEVQRRREFSTKSPNIS